MIFQKRRRDLGRAAFHARKSFLWQPRGLRQADAQGSQGTESHMLGVQSEETRGANETGNVSKGEILYSLVDSVVNVGFRPDLELRIKGSLR